MKTCLPRIADSMFAGIAALACAAFENLVYDPATELEKIAYWKFHNSITANAILFFAKATRKAMPKEKEIDVFFGYYLTSCVNQTSFSHLDDERVYASQDTRLFGIIGK